jgi:sodium-coupled monocarboxylate transporter 8/12
VNYFDWGIIVLYIIGIVAMGAFLGRGQSNINDDFLGGQKVSWWESGLSTMSSQLGAISFISAAAFVALKDGGGLKWLAYDACFF